jgi:hypothetical protein
MRLTTGVISIDDFPHKKIVLLDLTVFLLTFTEVFKSPILEFVNVVDGDG